MTNAITSGLRNSLASRLKVSTSWNRYSAVCDKLDPHKSIIRKRYYRRVIYSQHDGLGQGGLARSNVVIDSHPVLFYVYKRPHVDYILQTVSQWYDLVVFTASMEVYGSGRTN